MQKSTPCSGSCATLSRDGGRLEGQAPRCLVAPGYCSEGRPSVTLPGPYTHAVHRQRFSEAQDRSEFLQAFVQVKLGHGVYCAEVIEGWLTREGLSMWKLLVKTNGRWLESHVPAFKTRQCAGLDGLCSCEREAAAAGVASRSEAPLRRLPGVPSDGLVTRHNRLMGEPQQ